MLVLFGVEHFLERYSGLWSGLIPAHSRFVLHNLFLTQYLGVLVRLSSGPFSLAEKVSWKITRWFWFWLLLGPVLASNCFVVVEQKFLI